MSYRKACMPSGSRIAVNERHIHEVFAKFGDPYSGLLLLQGFLALHHEACLSRPADVLTQFRTLEHCYDFDNHRLSKNQCDKPILQGCAETPLPAVLSDLQAAYAALLRHVFQAPRKLVEPLLQSNTAAGVAGIVGDSPALSEMATAANSFSSQPETEDQDWVVQLLLAEVVRAARRYCKR